uniref:Uncharacterized protein n=1 Tax=Anser brachyrhynchus TaxID=132585 RepID=A0A8B9BGG8_9AVES
SLFAFILLLAFPTSYLVPVAVGFSISVKQKVLGYTQLQKWPNVIGPYGLLQPVADWLKQFIKDVNFILASSLSMSVGFFYYYFYLFK